jgi:hypothetical protein
VLTALGWHAWCGGDSGDDMAKEKLSNQFRWQGSLEEQCPVWRAARSPYNSRCFL